MGRRTRIIFFTALMFCALNFLLPVIFQSSPAYAAIESNIVLGCPTDSSIKVSVLFTEDIPEEFKIGYGTDSGSGTTYAYTSEAIAASGVTTPCTLILSGLIENTRYFYRVIYIDSGATSYSDEYSFRTQANAGNEFTFVVQADPHFDPRVMDCSPVTPDKYDNDPDTWIETSNNIVDFYPVDNNRGAGDDTPDYYTNNTPDFFIDLGDTFMLEKVSGKNDYYGYGFTNYPFDGPDIDGNGDGFTYNDVDLTYGYVRNEFFSLASHSVPLFLVTGNHDSEKKTAISRDSDHVTWAITARRKYYLNPVPDGTFYTGSTEIDSFDSSIRDTWFEWKWGNAQFIVLDPYWYSDGNSYWGLTLGEDQYEWLHTILQEDNPDIKFKFVFLHYLVGGSKDSVGTGRGGIEYVPLYEWGGHETDPSGSTEIPPDIGEYTFDTNRSGWSHGPIHDMLVAGNVNAVFHGHDHLFVNQVLDDIYYIEVGQAGHGIGTPRPEHYGYMDYIGDAVGSSGYMRVTIDSTEAVLQYVRAVSETQSTSYTGDIDYEFTILAQGDPMPGDINNDRNIDLIDLIVSLQIATLANTETESVSTLADVNNDGKIGIEEAVYILRYCAEND